MNKLPTHYRASILDTLMKFIYSPAIEKEFVVMRGISHQHSLLTPDGGHLFYYKGFNYGISNTKRNPRPRMLDKSLHGQMEEYLSEARLRVAEQEMVKSQLSWLLMCADTQDAIMQLLPDCLAPAITQDDFTPTKLTDVEISKIYEKFVPTVTVIKTRLLRNLIQ